MQKAKKMRRLAQWLTQNGKDYPWLAEELGVTDAAISHYVEGRNLPNAKNLVRLSEITGIPCNELLPEEVAA